MNIECLGLKAPLNKVSLFGDILFQLYKMNEIVNKFLLAGDAFIPEMHLKQPRFTFRRYKAYLHK